MNAELTVRKTIKEHSLIEKGDRVVLGLSGGPDSLCLLYILAELRERLGFELEAFHLNHLMRGEDAEADVRFLEETCAGLDVPLSVKRVDVEAVAAETGISVEESGRKARHDGLLALAEGSAFGKRPGKAAFAHNRDDQAETVLMRILRGTGVHGLAAMEYERADGVIRPLLDTPRSEIEDFCRRRGLSPRFDSTNASDDYMRNRLRHSLLPQLAEQYNPSLKEGLVRLSRSASEDDDYLEAEAARFLREQGIEEAVRAARTEHVPHAGAGERAAAPLSEIRVSRRALKALHPAVFKRAVRRIFLALGLDEDIAGAHLEAFMRTVREGSNRSLSQFPHGYSAETAAGELRFRRPEGPERPICSRNTENSHLLEE